MSTKARDPSAPAHVEYLKVQNFRALRSVELRELTPLTVLLGPNGSGKSTLFDVFAFLSECFELGLRRAWDKRGRARELRTRGSDGPVTIEIKYREPGYPLITYHLAIEEERGGPVVAEEWLQWRRGSHGKPFRFLDYRKGQGRAVSGERPDKEDRRIETPLKSPDLLAANALGSSPSTRGWPRCATSSPAGTCRTCLPTAPEVSPRSVPTIDCRGRATTWPT